MRYEIVQVQSAVSTVAVEIPVPESIRRAGKRALDRFILFFTANIANPLTAKNYARDIARFFRWLEEHRIEDLENVSSLVVAAYREALWTYDRPAYMVRRDRPKEPNKRSVASIQRNLSSISALFKFLAEKDIVTENPVAVVKRPKLSRETGVTPVMTAAEVFKLVQAIPTKTLIGLRDRALIGIEGLTWARVEAVVALNLEDYFPEGGRWFFLFHEKNGNEIVRPVARKPRSTSTRISRRLGSVTLTPPRPYSAPGATRRKASPRGVSSRTTLSK